MSFLCTETDGLGMIHILLEMFRFREEIKFMDASQAVDIFTSLMKRKHEKNITLKAIDFVKSYQGQRYFKETEGHSIL